eukprot:5217214-Prorocentrum_lima.AAC.1
MTLEAGTLPKLGVAVWALTFSVQVVQRMLYGVSKPLVPSESALVEEGFTANITPRSDDQVGPHQCTAMHLNVRIAERGWRRPSPEVSAKSGGRQ